MPRDDPARVPSLAAPWLEPALIRALADAARAARAGGAAPAAVAQECRQQALACRPAWPQPWIEEAAAIALWVGEADG